MSNYSIGVSKGQVQVFLEESLPEQDIQQMLTFNHEDVEYLLRTHSGTQAYWEALSIRLNSRYENFANIWAKKWWAHSNTYARIVLASYGDTKPTVSTIQDMVIQIYSVDASDVERRKFAVQAHETASKRSSANSLDEYYALMFRYQVLTPPWYFETVSETVSRLKEDAELVKSIASELSGKSYNLNAYAKAFMSRLGNTGPMTVNEGDRMRSLGGKKIGNGTMCAQAEDSNG